MEIIVYLYPAFVSLVGVEQDSPLLFSLLRERNAFFRVRYWDGTAESIPMFGPAIVLASERMKCSPKDLVARCSCFGHLVFSKDAIVREDGILDESIVVRTIREWFYERMQRKTA